MPITIQPLLTYRVLNLESEGKKVINLKPQHQEWHQTPRISHSFSEQQGRITLAGSVSPV